MIVQNDQGQPAEINQIGEIIAISDYLSPGYWGRPDLTDKAFSINSEGKRMYHTGDLGIFRPDGSLEHHGRKDFQVKIGGERIELEEIEIALLNLPYVTEAAIGYQEDKDRETALIAYIVLAEGVKIKRKEILDRLVEILPAYMIPKQIILMEKLPLTRDGKINKLKLPDPNLNPQEREEPFIQPTSEIEVILVEIWKEVFNLKEISIHDDFLELGGQSIQAAKIISRVNDAFLIELNLGEILTFSNSWGVIAINCGEGTRSHTRIA